MKKPVVIILLVLAVAVISYILYPREKRDENIVELSGTMEVIEIDCSFKIGGYIRELLIEEGDSLNKGQLIGALDDENVNQDIDIAKTSIDVIKAQFPKLELQIRQASQARAKEIESALEKAEEAYSVYESLKSGARDEEIKRAEYLLRESEHALDYAEKNYNRTSNLYDKGAVPLQARDAAEAERLSALEKKKQAEESLNLLKAGPKSQDVEAAFKAYKQAESNYELALINKLDVAELMEEKKILENQLKNSREEMKKLEIIKKDIKLYSPADGVVLKKMAEQGENISAGVVVATIGNIKNIYLNGYVSETDLGKIRLGQKAEVKADTYPDKVYNGIISYVSDQAEFTPKNLTTKDDRVKLVYRVKISMDNSSGDLKPGMIADAIIKPDMN